MICKCTKVGTINAPSDSKHLDCVPFPGEWFNHEDNMLMKTNSLWGIWSLCYHLWPRVNSHFPTSWQRKQQKLWQLMNQVVGEVEMGSRKCDVNKWFLSWAPLSDRTFCDDGKSCTCTSNLVASGCIWLLSTSSMACMTNKLHFYLLLISFIVNSHMWPVATVLDSKALDNRH